MCEAARQPLCSAHTKPSPQSQIERPRIWLSRGLDTERQARRAALAAIPYFRQPVPRERAPCEPLRCGSWEAPRRPPCPGSAPAWSVPATATPNSVPPRHRVTGAFVIPAGAVATAARRRHWTLGPATYASKGGCSSSAPAVGRGALLSLRGSTLCLESRSVGRTWDCSARCSSNLLGWTAL